MRQRKYHRVPVDAFDLIDKSAIPEPENECGHYAYLKLQPWDERVEEIRAAAKAARKRPQKFCKVCRRWVRFDAWPPHLDGAALC